MEMLIDFSRYDFVTQTLNCFRSDELNNRMLGKLGAPRFEQYMSNHYNLVLVEKYLNGELRGNQEKGVFNSLIGMEFNLYLLEELYKLGCKNIQQEVAIKGTSLDATALLSGNEKVKMIMPNLQEEYTTLEPGKHTFEAKAHNVLFSEKPVDQIVKARGYYKNCHVFVLADTQVPFDINYAVRLVGGDIIRSNITKKQLIERVLNLKNKVLH